MWTGLNRFYTIATSTMIALLIMAVGGGGRAWWRDRHHGANSPSVAFVRWRTLAGAALFLWVAGSAFTPFFWPLGGR